MAERRKQVNGTTAEGAKRSVTIRKMDQNLWGAVRIYAIQAGMSVSDLVTQALRSAINGGK